MAAKPGFIWVTRPTVLSLTLKKWATDVDQAVWDWCVATARQAERYMKSKAPWTDRTGAARRGLTATAQRIGPGTFLLTLSHGVFYGLYLELRWGGRFGIVIKTLAQVPTAWAGFVRQMGWR